MTRTDWMYILRIMATLLLISPIIEAFWVLQPMSHEEAIMITGVMYLGVFLMVIPMWNYLEHGEFSYFVKKEGDSGSKYRKKQRYGGDYY